MKILTLAQAEERMRLEIQWGDEAITKFQKGLDEHPGSELETSMRLFEKVAMKEQAQYVLHAFEKKDVDVKFVIDYLSDDVLRQAKWPRRSTSPTSNLWAECTQSAKAQILNILMGGI